MGKKLYNAAKKYVKSGLTVVPVGIITRKPITSIERTRYRHKKYIEQYIKHWFLDSNFADRTLIGILTGEETGIVVVDVNKNIKNHSLFLL